MSRLVLAGAVVLGILLGAVQRDDPPPLLTWRGYRVLAGDFHVHGTPDGIPPWDVVREARRRGLDVVALTSHNSTRGWWLWQHAPWRPDNGVMVLPGEEMTSVGFHLALVGVTDPIDWRQTAGAAAAEAQAQGGIAILAHPAGDAFWRYISDGDLRAMDGVEVSHPQQELSKNLRRDFQAVYRRVLAIKPRIAAIGSSDFHYLAPLGLCRTYVFVTQATPDGVLEALRSARTVACDARGRTEGPPDLSAVVADRCRADVLAGPAGDTFAARAGSVLAWAALVGLVLFGAMDAVEELHKRSGD
jgi:hypothetical protein